MPIRLFSIHRKILNEAYTVLPGRIDLSIETRPTSLPERYTQRLPMGISKTAIFYRSSLSNSWVPYVRNITSFSALDAYLLYAYITCKKNTDIVVVEV